MSTTDRDLLYALYDVTKGFSRACCDLLEQADRVGPNATEVAERYDAILKLLERHQPIFTDRARRRRSPALARRLLDRSTALVELLDVVLRVGSGFESFGSLLLDGRGLHSSYFKYPRAAAPADLPDIGRNHLLGGVASDLLDLLYDLITAQGTRAAGEKFNNYVEDWVRVGSAHGFDIQRLHDTGLGELLTEDEFADTLNVTVSEFKALVRNKRVLSVPWWDGKDRFPKNQIVAGEVPERLADLLRLVDPALDPWLLAIWLMTPFRLESEPRIDLLASRWDDVEEALDEAEALAVPPRPRGTVPSVHEDRLRRMYAEASGVKVARVKEPPMLRVPVVAGAKVREPALGRTAANELRGELFRITRFERGAFYFSQADDEAAGGRFDLADEGDRGTCYTSLSAEGAIAEVFGRVLVINPADVRDRWLWRFRPTESVGPLLDLRSDVVLNELGLPSIVFTSRKRRDTQALAAQIDAAGFVGIVHPLREQPGAVGVALFGPGGRSAPESGRHDAMHMKRRPIAGSIEFWEYVETQRSRQDRPMVMLRLPRAL